MSLAQKVEAVIALLKKIETEFAPAVFANSFGAEDVVLNDLIAKHATGIQVFSLDTGRLPEETYRLMQKARDKYPQLNVKVYFPDNAAVEAYIEAEGPNGFYNSIDSRKKCCQIRKIIPLRKALSEQKAWITGLRREQSPTRTGVEAQELDKDNNLYKFNPLVDWTEQDVWDYIRQNDVPYNELHDRHYPSIGCGPCTRAISVGEDVRAGRWWWENPETKECGLHVRQG